MTGILASLAGVGTSSGGGGGTVTLVDTTVYDTQFYPQSGFASYILNANGFRYTQKGSGAPVLQAAWLTPQSGMSGYEVYATFQGGENSIYSPFDTWLNLGTTREWGIVLSSPGMIDSNFALQIRAVGTSTILATANVSLVVEVGG